MLDDEKIFRRITEAVWVLVFSNIEKFGGNDVPFKSKCYSKKEFSFGDSMFCASVWYICGAVVVYALRLLIHLAGAVCYFFLGFCHIDVVLMKACSFPSNTTLLSTWT